MRRTDTLIVGGGPAGASAAIALARAGRPALLIERDREPGDALCGGFLSWTTLRRLEALGVDAMALGAHRIERLALFTPSRTAEAALPAPAAGLSRQVLDTALIDRARAEGAGIERGIGARAFEGGAVRLDDSTTVDAIRVILATGKHELRGLARPHLHSDAAIGLRWRLKESPGLARLLHGRIELHLFRGGYAGLTLQEDGANLCLAVRRSRLAACGGQPADLLDDLAEEMPALRVRLEAAAAIEAPQAIANIPYGWRAAGTDPRLYRVGDQAGVIPSLAGEGIAIALTSAAAAARAILHDTAFQTPLAGRLRRPIAIAGTVWRLAERPSGATMMVAAARFAPSLAGAVARLTRVD